MAVYHLIGYTDHAFCSLAVDLVESSRTPGSPSMSLCSGRIGPGRKLDGTKKAVSVSHYGLA